MNEEDSAKLPGEEPGPEPEGEHEENIMPEWSLCHDCLRFGNECQPTPEQMAQKACPDYDSICVADRLTEDIYPFGIGMPDETDG